MTGPLRLATPDGRSVSVEAPAGADPTVTLWVRRDVEQLPYRATTVGVPLDAAGWRALSAHALVVAQHLAGAES